MHKLKLSVAGKRTLHKASVISVKLDPSSSRVCASASADGTCYITSCYDKNIDTQTTGPFGSVTSSGETLISFNAIGWVNTVQFSPDST